VRWLLVGALAAAVESIATLSGTLEVRKTYPSVYRTAAIALTGSAALIVAVGLTDWSSWGTLAAMVLLLGMPIAVGLAAWLRRFDSEDQALLRAGSG
jgi:hypothetical protein